MTRLREPLINRPRHDKLWPDSEGHWMDAQLSFASLDFAGKRKRTKRDVFLAEIGIRPIKLIRACNSPHPLQFPVTRLTPAFR